MKGYIAFTKKEFLESVRSFKLFIMLAVFLLFGMMSPLLAKLMPDIFASMNMDGIIINIKEPTAIDAYTQFFKNVSQMGIPVLLLVFSSVLSGELVKGTLIGLVTKGLSRTSIILSKFTVSLTVWTASLCLSAVTTYFYTLYFWGSQTVKHLFFSMACLWLFGVLLICCILLSGIVFKGHMAGLILPAVLLGVLFFIGIFQSIAKYSPLSLASSNVALLKGTIKLADVMPSFITAIILCVVLLACSIVLFRKKLL